MDTGYVAWLYKVSDWIMKLALVNLLWIGFSLSGMLIFGFFPATIAMFTIVRQWIRKNYEIPVFHTFWNTYKMEFFKSNLLGIIFLLISYITYINIRFLSQLEGLVSDTLSVFYIGFIIIFIIIFLYIFPVFCHYKAKIAEHVKYALVIGVTHPLITLLMFIAVLFFYYVTLIIPAILLFFTGSGLAFVIMWLANFVFSKLESAKHSMKKIIT